MEEAILYLAIERISDFLIHEAFFLKGVNEQVESLKDELKRMQCFLKDADRKPEQDERLRYRVTEIRDLAYDAEDVIDSFLLKAAHQAGFRGIIRRFTSIFTKPSHLHKISMQVKEIQTKLENISKSLPAYEISGEGDGSSSFSGMQQQLRRTYSHVEEEDVISLEVSTKDVLAQLMTEEDRLHAVVSIVGMGGIGKTTLARKVYNHVDVKRRFDCLAWVFVSQQCKPREVLHGVLMKVVSPSKDERELIEKLSEVELIRRLSRVLKEKRYLVVFDDIWRSEDWLLLKPAFPRGKKGSKILLTTRNRNVALAADPCNSPIELPLLTNDESWKLLRRKAFPQSKTDSHACSKEFEVLGKEMVKKCGGLPLAIVVLGGLLATKQAWAQWEMVHENIHGHLKGFQQQDRQYSAVNGILALSYNELPYYLKPCFLYLGHYPEDWEISKVELIRLWIAEGFISPSLEKREMLMEDVGEQFLEELINRCLVQVGQRDYTGTNVKTCRVHDLLRDLCVEKAREENFLEIIQQPLFEEYDMTLAEPKLRRIAIHPSKRYVCLKGEHRKLRSMLLFQNEELIDLHISNWKNFKFLRVLNLLKNDYTWNVPSEIGNLHHLRYLRLNCYNGIILPRAIGKLKSLYTLYLQYSGNLVIPNVLFKLERLRHIVLRNQSKEWIAKDMCFWSRFTSKNIETLKYIVVEKKLFVNAVLRLTNVRSLGIIFNRSNDVKPVLKYISELHLHRLRSLAMNFVKDSIPSYLDLEPLSQCHHLSKLFLEGKIEEDPHSSHHVLKFLPPNIVKLTLSGSKMEQDPMGVLEKLPHLRILRLWGGSYKGNKLICSANGFLQLHSLDIQFLRDLKEWEIEEGAMPRLQSLHLSYVDLRIFPEGLKYITTLQEMTLKGMQSSLKQRIKVIDGKEGEDFYKVRHISSILLP